MTSPGGVVQQLRNGMFKGITRGELEVTQRRNGKGTDIYVRIPEGEA